MRMKETSDFTNMKKKSLFLLLIPLLLTSCGKSGVPFATIKGLIDNIGADDLFPYYHVTGMMDFNNCVIDVDANFTNTPKENTYVPYARYNEGFYNASLDITESKPENIIIYGMSSKSYWLRAPLRINKENFYKTVANTTGTGKFNDMSINVNYETGRIGTIGKDITGAKIELVDLNTLNMTYKMGEVETALVLTRENPITDAPITVFNGTWKDTNGNVLVLKQGERENRTCAHSLIQSIITSYAGQQGSINPSRNVMTYETLPNGGFAFVGNKVHTNVTVDNYPYYFDPAKLELEWDESNPLPCYKSQVNAKVNIRFEYDSNGWLVKESMTSLEYNYSVATDAQISLVATYTYKFN